MKIVCDSCATKYSIADEKVRGKVFKIRCKKCGHVIVVRGGEQVPSTGGASDVATASTASASATESPAGAAAAEAVWHLVIDREQVGPVTADDVRAKFLAGQIDVESYAWREGFADWLRLGSIDDFADLRQPVKEAAPAKTVLEAGVPASVAALIGQPARAATARGHEDDGETRRSEPSELAAAHQAMQSREDDGGAAALFSAPPTTILPVPADPGAAHAAVAAAPAGADVAAAMPRLTAQRNENSVLFSLSNLQALATGKSDGKAGAARPGFASAQSEGSGLIDIRAMAAQTLSSSPASDSIGGATADVPMSAPPVFGPVAAPVLMPTAVGGMPKWVWGVIIGGGAVVAVMVALVVVMVMRKPELPPQYAIVPLPTTQTPKVAVPMAPAGEASAKVEAPAPAKAETPTDIVADKREKASAKVDSAAMAASKKDKGKKERVGKPEDKVVKVVESPVRRAAPASSAAAETAPATHRPRRGGDSLDELLNQAAPSETVASRRARPAASAASEAAPAGGDDLPEQLGRDEIKRGMAAIQGRALACYQQYHVPGTALVQVVIGKNGRVTSTEVKGVLSGTPTGECVAKAVRGASFGKFKGDSMSITYPFILH